MYDTTLKFARDILENYYKVEKKNDLLIKYRNDLGKLSLRSYQKIKDMSFDNAKAPVANLSLTNDMVLEFLENYFIDYIDIYKNLLLNNKINFIDVGGLGKYTSINWHGTEVSINIVLTNTILDVHYIIHEFMHYLHFIKNKNNIIVRPTVESVPILSEFLVNQYLLTKGYSQQDISRAFAERLNLIKNSMAIFLENNEVLNKLFTGASTEEVLKSISCNTSFWEDFVEPVQSRNGDPLRKEMIYIIGLYIASYFADKEKDVAKLIKEFNKGIIEGQNDIYLLKHLGFDLYNIRHINEMVKSFDSVYEDNYSKIKTK